MQLAGRDKKGVPPPSLARVGGDDRFGERRPREIGRRQFLALLAGGLTATVIEEQLGLWAKLRTWFFPAVPKIV